MRVGLAWNPRPNGRNFADQATSLLTFRLILQRYKEWISWSDWLGTDTVAPQLIQFRTFKQARAYARSLNLESRLQWQRHWESRKRPLDIPASPRNVYIGKGWLAGPIGSGPKPLPIRGD